LITVSLAQASALERLFVPDADLWEKWDQHDPESVLEIDHSHWDTFLQAYVRSDQDGINRVKYGQVSEADRQSMQTYLATLQAIRIHRYNRSEQLAFWINLYNALTVNVILEHYPVNSIRDIDISPGFLADGPWGKELATIEGEAVSLNDIEHRILRPIWKDPRIHYAINCASLGCPNLRKKAFKASTVNETLNQAARDFINHPRAVSIKDGELTVSSIYSWFQEDFGENEQDVIRHLQRYARPDLARQLKNIESISDDEYNWQINDASSR